MFTIKIIRYFRKNFSEYVERPLYDLLNRNRRFRTSPLTHEEIASLVGKPNPTILEIGCNDGTDTLEFLRVMPHAKIYCFEPDPRAIARFKKNLGSQLDKVHLNEMAISDRTGQTDFHCSSGGDDLPDGWDLSGSIRSPKNHLIVHPWVSFKEPITVRTYRLDDWCAENGVKQIDFIWMDAQGAEGDVISGARQILQETRFLYTEYSNDELYEGQLPLKRLLALLPAFRLVAQYAEDVLLKNKKLSVHSSP